MYKVVSAVAVAAVVLGGGVAQANEFKPQIDSFFQENIQGWLSDAAVIEAIKAQNTAHSSLTDADIDTLDKTWRAEAKSGGGDLVNKLLENELSKFLSGKKSAHNGTITEIFVMDNKGLNVGQSAVTSDYMQGDEAKWQKTYGTGAAAVFVDEVEFDESSQSFQSQVSATIVDPSSGSVIGAITVGLNVENLM